MALEVPWSHRFSWGKNLSLFATNNLASGSRSTCASACLSLTEERTHVSSVTKLLGKAPLLAPDLLTPTVCLPLELSPFQLMF